MIAAQTLLQTGVLTEVYRAAPTFGRETCANVVMCNQDGGQWTTLDVALARDGTTPTAAQYIIRGYSAQPNETKHLKLLLREEDRIYVRATTARVSVTVVAEEVVTPHVLEQLGERIDAVVVEVQQLREALGVPESV